MNIRLFGLFVLAVTLMVSVQEVYGHGLGLDTIKPVNVGDKKIVITAQITPTEFSVSSEKRIIVTVADMNTNQNISNVVLFISLYHDGEVLFEDTFFSSDGTIIIRVNPVEDGDAGIVGQRHSEFDAWYGTESAPIQLVGPVFGSGGLYSFEIERIAISWPDGISENLGSFFADVTLTTNQPYIEHSRDGHAVDFGVKSYYDEVSSFDYDPNSNLVSFEMPFDWREQNISHVPVVHEEVHFSKDFADFFAPSYVGKLNGIELFKSSVTIDDYTDENERIVHFVISQDNLRYLKQVQKDAGVESPQGMVFTLEPNDELVFPVVAITRDEQIQVDLSWDPLVIEPEKNTKFIFTFRDAKTGELLRNTSYDFVISQNGRDVYKKSGNAQIGSDFVDYGFSDAQKGQASIRFENLRGTDRSTEFAIMVVPEFGHLAFVILSVAVGSSIMLGKKFRSVST
jgi:hypothetical protein